MAAFTTINDPEAHFQALKYTGNGSSQSMTLDGTTDMQPDFVWIKNLQDAENHNLTDSVRGAEKVLFSNATNVEATETNGMSSFDSDGFGVSVTNGALNASGEPFIAYCWKAGTTSGLSGGSITPDAYSFNATSGFSIVKFEGNGTVGATVAHALGAVPKAIIIKGTDNYVNNWQVYHVVGGNTGNYVFNNTDAFADDDSRWNDTTPSSTVWTMGSGATLNYDGRTFVAYVFADIQGFSKFGTYKGNGDADGPYIFLGFRPALLIIKRKDSTGDWLMYDIKRDGFNDQNDYLKVNATTAEQADVDIDILGSGFKIRNTSNDGNN